MKLAEIFAAKDAWSRLTNLRLPAHTAYRLLKFAKQVTAEYAVIEQQRNKLILDAADAKEGEMVTLKPGTPEFERFASEFGAVLDTDSDLKPFAMTLSALLDVIGKDAENTLSIVDLAQLEPFFAADAPKE